MNTNTDTSIPTSTEVIGAMIAEKCYGNRKFYQQLSDNPLEMISRLVAEKIEKPIDFNKILPSSKIHVLKNTNKRWHIVLPYEYLGEAPCEENGLLSEEELEQVAGGVFGLITLGSLISAAAAAGAVVLLPTGAVGAVSVATVATGATLTGTFASTGFIAGAIAATIVGGAALTAGVTVGTIAGLDAAGIIDTW